MDLKALYLCSYGLYVICSKKAEKFDGQIVNTVFQVTAEPPAVAVSVNKENLTHSYISSSKVFSVSILSKDAPMIFIGKWGFKSGRDIDKFEDTQYRIGTTGAPIVLDHALAYLDTKVLNSVDVGTHTIFIGQVVDAGIISDGEPMTYAYYHEVKKGKTPEKAPVYVKGQVGQEPTEGEVSVDEKKSGQYRCTVCGYIYDPEKGDPDNGIPPGTAFEDVRDDWVCPVCGVGKDRFEPVG